MAPELRVVTCQSERELPDAIGVQLQTWGAFEKIEVYDADDWPVVTFSYDARPGH